MQLDFINVSKIYKNSSKKALDNASFSIKGNELVGFVGPNGSGKSTTINSIINLISFDGNILLDQKSIKDHQKEFIDIISYVPDNIESLDHLTSNDLISLFSSLHKIENLEQKIDKLLTDFKFPKDKLNDRISTLSKGTKQKISIIVALLFNPKILILDEPLNGIDPYSSYILKKYMKEIVENGGIVFFSSHILDVVEKLCTRVIFINNGKIVGDYKIEQLYKMAEEKNKKVEDLFLEIIK